MKALCLHDQAHDYLTVRLLHIVERKLNFVVWKPYVNWKHLDGLIKLAILEIYKGW